MYTNNRSEEASQPRTKSSKIQNGDAAEILGEQQMESDLEELWMDGPALVDEELPRTKTLRKL